MSYTHIVFDIDGTLIDSNYVSLLSLQQAIKLYTGNTLDLQKRSFSIGLPASNVFKVLGITDIKYVEGLWDECYQQYITKILPFPGIKEVLEILVQNKYTLGIITSKTRSEYQKEFELMQISKYFQYSICLDECISAKPSPEPLYTYMKQTKVLAENILYIGDTYADMQCAQSASVDFALAHWDATQSELIAKYYLENPCDLLKILEVKYEDRNYL